LEHDVTSLYKSLEKNTFSPAPLPLGIAVINNSCLLFAHIFGFVANKHRLQMLNHFQDCIKHAKASRQEAIQINILTAVVGALKVYYS
jgi:HEAT repeat-containing protein 5B, putative